MKNLIGFFILIAVLCSTIDKSYSQYNFKADEHYIPENSRYLDILKIQTFDSNNMFEMRIWINPSFNPSNLCRFVLKEDSTWFVEKYDLFRKRKGITFEKSTVELGKEWTANMDSLIDWGILALPDWTEVRNDWKGKMEVVEGDTLYGNIIVADGTSYTIEILTKNKKRQYNYHCPKTYRDYYKNVDDLNSIMKILEKIFKEIEYKHVICKIINTLPPTMHHTA